MNLSYFSLENLERCAAPDGFNQPIDSWSLSDWMTAACGELGEAANIIKKINRFDGQYRPDMMGKTWQPDDRAAMVESLGKEIADTICYLDLLATAAGLNLEDILVAKWNEVSNRVGYGRKLI